MISLPFMGRVARAKPETGGEPAIKRRPLSLTRTSPPGPASPACPSP